MKLIEAGIFGGPYVATEVREKAEHLEDAFSELLGRQLNRPTAGSLGKLLNNRLVDRPTRIDASTVATLKTFKKRTTPATTRFAWPARPTGRITHSPIRQAAKPSPASPLGPPRGGRPAGDKGDAGHVSSPPAPAPTENDDDLPDVPPGEEFVV